MKTIISERIITEKNIAKKLLAVSLLSVAMLSFTACGKKEEPATTEATTEAEKKKSLDDLAKYLVDGGYVTGEQSETMYSYIGAIGGFKYLDSNVEVYEYDTNSDTYNDIVKTSEVSGLKVSAVNGPYVLIFSGGNENQDVIDAFNKY